MQETQVQYLGGEDPLEKEMATHSSCLGYAMDRGAWQATVHGISRVRHDLVTKQPHHTIYICIIYLYKILLMLCSVSPNSNIEVLLASFDYLFFLLVNGNSINSQVKKKKCTLFEPH